MAVVITFTLTNADALDVAAACGDKLGLRNAQGTQRDATGSEVKADITEYVKAYTRAHKIKVRDAAALDVTDVDPT